MATLATVTGSTVPWQESAAATFGRVRLVRQADIDLATAGRLAATARLQIVDVCQIVADPAWQTDWDATTAQTMLAGIAGRVGHGCTPDQVATVLLAL